MTETDISFATLDDINAIVLVADTNGNIIFVNKAIKQILGYDQQEVLGDGWWQLMANGQDRSARKTAVAAMAAGTTNLQDRHLFESALPTKDGRIVWTQWTNTRTPDGLVIGTSQDITEKKILEEKLIRKNRENELLLKEMHHRVKNNLQIITSLLNLQFKNIDNKHVIDALAKSKDRINSMALVHTTLYQSGNLASINFGEYISELTVSITASCALNDNIKCTVKHSDPVFDIDLSINLGLIITELLTNACKHAFKDKKEGLVKVELTSKGNNKHQLIIEDNGTGMTYDMDTDSPQSLGLEIVKALTDQINGTIEIASNGGLKYLINFEQ